MPKRTPVSSPSPRSKKKKSTVGQHTLDSFFGQGVLSNTPSSRTDSHIPPKRASEPVESRASPQQTSSSPTDFVDAPAVEVIDVDLLEDADDLVCSSPTTQTVPPVPECQHPTLAPGLPGSMVQEYSSLACDPKVFDTSACPWSPHVSTPYSFLAHVLATLSGTRSRIMIINTLTNALRCIILYHPPSLLPALYLLSNSLSPPYSPVELGLGPSIIFKGIQTVSGLTSAALRKLYTSTGDAGDVAFEAKSKVRTLMGHAPLLVTSLYASLLEIAHAKGTGAAKKKQRIVEKLLLSAQGEEVRFLARTLVQHIRVGAVRTSLLVALARAFVLTPRDNAQDTPQVGYHVDLEEAPSQLRTISATRNVTNSTSREELNRLFLQAEALVKRAYVQHPNYDDITEVLLVNGLHDLCKRVYLSIGIPLLPTLGSPARSLDEVYERVQENAFTAEYKYDGQRAQIHASRDAQGNVSVRVFSRHLEDMTNKFPDVVLLLETLVRNNAGISSFIIDSEVVAIDPNDESLRPFQELSNRPRKDVLIQEIKVPVAVFVFDLMYLNGKVLLEEPFRRRRGLLHENFPPNTVSSSMAARLKHVEYCDSQQGKEAVEEFWLKAVEDRCEGLMIKILDSGEVMEVEDGKEKRKVRKKPLLATYEPDKRTSAWLKLKKDYVMDLSDSLDLIPIGGWHGNGRKSKWWSPVLLAVRDSETGVLTAVCKCMSGELHLLPTTVCSLITCNPLQDMKARYSEESANCSPHPLWGNVDTGGYSPAVHFRPHEVWEIRGADITLSPVSVAARGLVSDTRGLSLRFPRFVRLREDKPVEAASSPEFLTSMWRKQEARGGPRTAADDGELVDIVLSEEDVVGSDLEDEA